MPRGSNLDWNPITANFGDVGQSMANAQRGISEAGNIFGKITDTILKERQLAEENAFKQKTFDESVRQFGLTHGLNIDKLKEDIRKTNVQAETARRGQDKSLEGTKYSADTSARTAANRLAFDKAVDKRKADTEARTLETSNLADEILQGLAVKTGELQRENTQKLADFDAQLSSPEMQIALSDPIRGEQIKQDMQKQREALVRSVQSPVSPGEILTNFTQEMQRAGKGSYVLPILKEDAEKSGDHARAIQLQRIKDLNDKAKGNDFSMKDYQSELGKQIADIGKSAPDARDKASQLATFMETEGYDRAHIISVLRAVSRDTSILERNLPDFSIGSIGFNKTDAYYQISNIIEDLTDKKKLPTKEDTSSDNQRETPPPNKSSRSPIQGTGKLTEQEQLDYAAKVKKELEDEKSKKQEEARKELEKLREQLKSAETSDEKRTLRNRMTQLGIQYKL